MALDDDNGQSVLFVAGHNHFIHFPNTYESEVYHFVSDVQTLSPVSVYYAERTVSY